MKWKISAMMIVIQIFAFLLPNAAFGAGDPFKLEAPTNLRAELKYDIEGVPYFELKADIPQSVRNINRNLIEDSQYYEGTDCYPVEINFDFKYANYDWNEGPSTYWNTSMSLTEYLDAGTYEYRPFDRGTGGNVDIKAETYQFRAYFSSSWGYIDDWCDKLVKSPYSNIVTIGNTEYKEEIFQPEDEGFSRRLYGADRIETAIAISKEGWPNGAATVILTRDDNYPDALTGAPLSKKLDAPILFTNSKVLTGATEDEIARLKAKKVIILGGAGAVSQDIENKLSQSYQVQRIGGIDRYETAAKIAKELGYKGKAVITTGEDFHDALVVSPLAAFKGIPILLTLPGLLPSFTRDALEFVAPTEITVVGNTTWVSETVYAELSNAKRITGSDIYQSAVNTAKNFGADPAKIFLATGKDFPDALAGSGLAAKFNSPILFVNDPISAHVIQYLTENKGKTTSIVYLLGGEGAISKNIKDTVDKIFE